jgi:hypothetical protein
VRGLALAAAAALGAGCAGELEEPERFANCPPGYVERLFQTRCAGECHTPDSLEAGLDLTSSGVEGRLVGELSGTPFCDGRVLIDPSAAEMSDHLLIDKLSETPSCGARMPFGEEALTQAELECVRRWVDETLGAEAP